MDPISTLFEIAALLVLWGSYAAYQKLKKRLRNEKEDHSVNLFCPNREERVPIASEEIQPKRYNEDTGAACYVCEECGKNHTWVWGPPAPIYIGDKIRLKVTTEEVQEETLAST